MTNPARTLPVSAVTGKVLSAATRATYAADWAFFTDWCTATDHSSLPADAAALAGFAQGCPSAPATHRRRLAAIAHHHRIHGHQLPVDDNAAGAPAVTRAPINPVQAALAMQLLPSHGWIGGLFGRRDRALLVIAAGTNIPYRQIAGLTVDQFRLEPGGDGTITDARGTQHRLPAGEDPVLCGPCALVRWRRILDITVASKTRLDDFLAHAKQVTRDGHHPCRTPKPIDARTSAVVLCPPIDQWGHFAVQIRPLTPHAISRLARQADTGLAAHKMLRVDELTTVLHDQHQAALAGTTIAPAVLPAPSPASGWDWAAANERKKAAITALAPLTDVLDDVDARIEELLARVKQLERP